MPEGIQLNLDVRGFTALECDSNAEPEEFLEILNGDPDFVEASLLNTGKRQFDLDDAAMFLWQSEMMENSHLFAIRELEGRLVGLLTLLIPHSAVRQPWIGALFVHRDVNFEVVAVPLLDAVEWRLTTDGWDSIYVSPMTSRQDAINHWRSLGYVFLETRLDNNQREVNVLRKSLKQK